MQDRRAPEKLRDFQIRYGKYLRNPDGQRLPEGVPKRRSEIYEGLLFSNISGFINNCFPVAKSLHTEKDWEVLIRAFFKDWRCTTPIFSQIPFEFVRFVSETLVADTQPPWLSELLHYEWVELEVDLDESEGTCVDSHTLRLNPTAKLLSYSWPVHLISKTAIPRQPESTFIVVYRKNDTKVRFSELNATTFMLLQHVFNFPGKIEDIINDFVAQMNSPEPDAVSGFAFQILRELHQQEIVIGTIE